MKNQRPLRHGLLTGLLAAAGIVAVAVPPMCSGETAPAALAEGAGGMTIHVDPKTGAIVKEPAPGTVPLQLSPQLRNALSTSHQGLVEAPSPVHGGGVKLDLQGRFKSPLMATIDADGKLNMQHLHETPALVDTP